MVPLVLIKVIQFMAGAALFSFFDVLVWRLPRKESILWGRSRCESCRAVLSPWNLIPVVSWLFLRGRCHSCGAKIPLRCLGMELAGGAALWFLVWRFDREAAIPQGFLGASWAAWWALVLLGLLLAVARLDLDTGLIPDRLNMLLLLWGILAGFLFSAPPWRERLVGMLCVSVPMWLLCMAVPEAFGGGDIKLMAAAGMILGWQQVLLAFFIALVSGGAAAAGLLLCGKAGRNDHLAFGPYLCAGIGIALVFGEKILAWYLG